ncbi:MAG: hypothetical protein EBV03_12025 [Proteobacteria bacterium]|nr:hypothetical protein [Pseudomonadota bacterium]
MAEKKQWSNDRRGGARGPEKSYDASKAAKARAAFDALFRDAPEPPAQPQPSPLQWDAQSLKELKAVADRLKLFRGQYSGDFHTPGEDNGEMSAGLRRMMNAFGRAQQVLAAFQIEMRLAGKDFVYSATPPEGKDKSGTICMPPESYAQIAPFLQEKSNTADDVSARPARRA